MFPGVPVASSVEELPSFDGALLCLPTERITETAHLLLQHGIPIVECGNFAGDALHAHKDKLHRIAVRITSLVSLVPVGIPALCRCSTICLHS